MKSESREETTVFDLALDSEEREGEQEDSARHSFGRLISIPNSSPATIVDITK
jgi:hypothetical protein